MENNKRKIYIIEGCDATGKTTLISELQQLTGLPVVQGSSFEIAQKGIEHMFNFMKEQLKNPESFIMDRSFISNLVYGPLYDKNTLSESQVFELVDLLDGDAELIYLTASPTFIEKRLNLRGADYVASKDVSRIVYKYEQVVEQFTFSIDTVTYDVELIDSYSIAQEIFEFWQEEEGGY